MKAIIPIAGLGTRFLPIAKSVPKAMFPIIDKPVIHYLVEEAISCGIRDIIFVVSEGQDALKNYFNRNYKLEAELKKKKKKEALDSVKNIHKLANFHYVKQEKMKGNGDALLKAEKLLRGEPCLVMFGDDLVVNKKSCAKQMVEVYNKYKAPVVALMRVPKEKIHLYGSVDGDKKDKRLYKINKIVEKPDIKNAPSNLIVVGKYIITSELFQAIKKTEPDKKGEIGLSDTLGWFSKQCPVYGWEFEGTRYDCGSKFEFLKANIEIGLKHPETGKELKKFLKTMK